MRSIEPEIEVLMATWNGARYVEGQLDSLFSQTTQNFRLVVRDDGSSDSTLCIVERYKARYPDRVAIRKNPSRQGPCRTFSLLAEESVAPYVAFCDQDDVWRPDKLELSVSAIKAIEAERGAETPVLAFSDMEIVDDGSQVIAPSLWRLGHINPDRATLGAMLVQNLVTGCTVLANRSLILKGSPIPEGAVMHDTWLGLTAVVFGVVHPLRETTVQYRQHGGNAIGAGRGWRSGSLLKRLRHDQAFKDRIEASRRQAQVFTSRYGNELTKQQNDTLAIWSHSRNLPVLLRHWTLHRNGLRGTTFFNHLGFLVRV
ncbi:MAG: glycosyltransferase family 2 protein [Candidatus Sulfotelmatobacter sp.]